MSNQSNNKKEKALHNLKIATLLNKSGEKCSDWIITISFYSALHYVDYLLFPIKFQLENGKIVEYRSYDSFYSFYNSLKPRQQSKHSFRAKLVELYLDEYVHQFFDYLRTECMKARYLEYPIDTNTEHSLGSVKSILQAKKTNYKNIIVKYNDLNNI